MDAAEIKEYFGSMVLRMVVSLQKDGDKVLEFHFKLPGVSVNISVTPRDDRVWISGNKPFDKWLEEPAKPPQQEREETNNTLKPGRELDALIAEKVMGLEVISAPARYLEIAERGGDFFGRSFVTTVLCHNETFSRQSPGRTIAIVPQYSTSIDAAWRVVDKLRAANQWIRIDCFKGKWTAGPVEMCGDEDYIDNNIEADTAQHAICLAALAVKGVSDDV